MLLRENGWLPMSFLIPSMRNTHLLARERLPPCKKNSCVFCRRNCPPICDRRCSSSWMTFLSHQMERLTIICCLPFLIIPDSSSERTKEEYISCIFNSVLNNLYSDCEPGSLPGKWFYRKWRFTIALPPSPGKFFGGLGKNACFISAFLPLIMGRDLVSSNRL